MSVERIYPIPFPTTIRLNTTWLISKAGELAGLMCCITSEHYAETVIGANMLDY